MERLGSGSDSGLILWMRDLNDPVTSLARMSSINFAVLGEGEGAKDTLEELRNDTGVWARDSHSRLPSVAGAPLCSTSPAFAPHQAYLLRSHSAVPSGSG